jgi:hypothetical protein
MAEAGMNERELKALFGGVIESAGVGVGARADLDREAVLDAIVAEYRLMVGADLFTLEMEGEWRAACGEEAYVAFCAAREKLTMDPVAMKVYSGWDPVRYFLSKASPGSPSMYAWTQAGGRGRGSEVPLETLISATCAGLLTEERTVENYARIRRNFEAALADPGGVEALYRRDSGEWGDIGRGVGWHGSNGWVVGEEMLQPGQVPTDRTELTWVVARAMVMETVYIACADMRVERTDGWVERAGGEAEEGFELELRGRMTEALMEAGFSIFDLSNPVQREVVYQMVYDWVVANRGRFV